jgi:hypothetical protein
MVALLIDEPIGMGRSIEHPGLEPESQVVDEALVELLTLRDELLVDVEHIFVKVGPHNVSLDVPW